MGRSCDRCGQVGELPVELGLPSVRDHASTWKRQREYLALERGGGRAHPRPQWLGRRPVRGMAPLGEPRRRQAPRARVKMKKGEDGDRGAKRATERAPLLAGARLSTTPRTRALEPNGLPLPRSRDRDDWSRLSAILTLWLRPSLGSIRIAGRTGRDAPFYQDVE